MVMEQPQPESTPTTGICQRPECRRPLDDHTFFSQPKWGKVPVGKTTDGVLIYQYTLAGHVPLSEPTCPTK